MSLRAQMISAYRGIKDLYDEGRSLMGQELTQDDAREWFDYSDKIMEYNLENFSKPTYIEYLKLMRFLHRRLGLTPKQKIESTLNFIFDLLEELAKRA